LRIELIYTEDNVTVAVKVVDDLVVEIKDVVQEKLFRDPLDKVVPFDKVAVKIFFVGVHIPRQVVYHRGYNLAGEIVCQKRFYAPTH
jgi:hypothetical protein